MNKTLHQIWKNKSQILEGITNTLFKKEDIERVAAIRMEICEQCEMFDLTGKGCVVPGSQPCCSHLNGGCGCSLKFATRSMSKSCPVDNWEPIMTIAQEDELNYKLNQTPESNVNPI